MLKKNSNQRFLSIDKESTIREKPDYNISKRSVSTLYLQINSNIPNMKYYKFKDDSFDLYENSISSSIPKQNNTISHELIQQVSNIRGNNFNSPKSVKKKFIYNPNVSNKTKKSNDLVSIFKSEGIVYQSLPTIEDICNRNNTILHNNKNEQNMRKVIKMRMYDNTVMSMSRISKILNKQLNGRTKLNLSNSLSKDTEKKKNNHKKKSISQEAIPRESFLITSLPLNNKLPLMNRFSLIANQDKIDEIPPLYFNQKQINENNVKASKLSPTVKRKQKFLEIYKTSLEKEDFINRLKKKKDIPLHKYQENLMNAVYQELDQEDLVSLITKFNEIRTLDEECKIEYSSNKNFYDKLVNVIRNELDYIYNEDDKPNKKEKEKKEEIKYKYKKNKRKVEKNMEKLKNIIPKFLYDKLNNNI